MSQVKFYKRNDLNISTVSGTFDNGGIIFKKNTATNPTNNYSRIYTKESEGLVEYYKEDLELFSGTTTKTLGNIPAGTDLSSSPKRVIDIIKELLFATYAPKWTNASITTAVTYLNGPTGNSYYKKGSTKEYTATLTVTATPASASASEDGTSNGQKRTVSGGNLSKVTCDGAEVNATGTNTFTKTKNLTLDTSTITTLKPSSFTLSTIKFLGNDSTTVKDSKGENTKKTGSNYNVELKDANNNTNIDDYFHIKPITLSDGTNISITDNIPGTYYIYLPIYLSIKLTDIKVSDSSSSITLNKSSNTNSSSNVVDFDATKATTYEVLSDANSFKLETSYNYIGFVIPSQGDSLTQRPFIVLPSGYTISEIYTEALSGQAEILNNASSHNALWYTKSDSPTEIDGQDYYKFTLNLKDNSGAGPVILKIVTE